MTKTRGSFYAASGCVRHIFVERLLHEFYGFNQPAVVFLLLKGAYQDFLQVRSIFGGEGAFLSFASHFHLDVARLLADQDVNAIHPSATGPTVRPLLKELGAGVLLH